MLVIGPVSAVTPGGRCDGVVITVESGLIAAVGPAADLSIPADAERLEGEGLVATPGFIDLQVNGLHGHDLASEPESVWAVAAELPRYGVTSFCPTIISSPPEIIDRALAALREGPPAGFGGARPLGLHLEGPYLAPERRGAHNPAYLKRPGAEPSPSWLDDELVSMVTLAPELDGAADLVRRLAARGALVSAGHSGATWEQAQQAFDLGVRSGTHLFNAMSALHHRTPGLAAALLARKDVVAGLIADGVHVHPGMVSLAWNAKGAAGLNLVTDSTAASGMPPGRYRLGDFEVDVDEHAVRLEDGTLAGSNLTLDRAVRNLVTYTGCTLDEAVATVTTTPADLLGLRQGRLEPGRPADVTLLDGDGKVRGCVVRGCVTVAT